MKFRTTLILLIIVVALGAYLLLVERKAPSSGEGGTAPAPTSLAEILSYPLGDVRGLSLLRPDTGQRTEIVRQDDGKWHLAVPVESEADQGRVIRLVESLSSLHPKRVLTGTIGALADYDLDPPAMQVEIEMKDSSVQTVNLGAKNPSGSGYYGQVMGDESLYLLPLSIGVDVDRYLNEPPLKPTPTPEVVRTSSLRIPGPPTATPSQ